MTGYPPQHGYWPPAPPGPCPPYYGAGLYGPYPGPPMTGGYSTMLPSTMTPPGPPVSHTAPSAAPAVVTATFPGVPAPAKNETRIESAAIRPESSVVSNPWSQATNAGNETMDVDEIRVMAEFPPLKRETSLSRAENSRRRRNEDQTERMQTESNAVRDQNESNRQKDQAKRPDLRTRQGRSRPRALTFKDYANPVIDKLGNVERRIAENKIRPGFLRISRNEDEKIFEYFERMTPNVGEKVFISYKTSDSARNSNVCLRVSENTVFIFVRN
jgi:hypothetical protein